MGYITDVVRDLRERQTKAEEMLWQRVRSNQLGVKIVRQQPILCRLNGQMKFFAADFCCRRKKIIIEVDGKIHETQQNQDKLREELLQKEGYTVIRFKNIEIEQDMENVLQKIKKICTI